MKFYPGYLYVLGVQRRTIYEYHRVEVDVTRIQSNTVVILEPLTSMSDGKIGFQLCGFYTYFFEHLKKTSNKFSSNLTRNSISNFVLPQTGIMMQDHWMKIRTSHDCSLYLLPLNKFSRKISHKLNIIRLQYYLCFPLLYNSL